MFILKKSYRKGHSNDLSLLNPDLNDGDLFRAEIKRPARLEYAFERSEPKQLDAVLNTSGFGFLFHRSLIQRLRGLTGFRTCPTLIRLARQRDTAAYSFLMVTGRTGPFEPERVQRMDVPNADNGSVHSLRGLHYAPGNPQTDFAVAPAGEFFLFVSERAAAVFRDVAPLSIELIPAADFTFCPISFESLKDKLNKEPRKPLGR
jgi:hypothetical protein